MASKRRQNWFEGEDDHPTKRSKNAVFKPFLETGLGKLPPEIRQLIFISLLATPSPYAGHDFAINRAGPKKIPSAPKEFVHIKASWYQVTQTCRQIYLESYPLFFASESYYLANPRELTGLLGSWYSTTPHIRGHTITTLCLEGMVTDIHYMTKEKIDEILSNPIHRRAGLTRQQLEAQTIKWLDIGACMRLRELPNLKTVGLRMRVGQEMAYLSFMYGVSGLRRGLVEFVDQSHWLIRTQHPNDVWRIQYACFGMADYGRDKNAETISDSRRRIELKKTDIDSRAPGLQEGDERYVEVLIRRNKSDDEIGTVSEVSDAKNEDLVHTQGKLRLESSDLSPTQIGELHNIPETTHDEVQIDLEVSPKKMDGDLQMPPPEHQDILEPAHEEVEIELKVPPKEMEDDLKISPLDKDLSGTELGQGMLRTSEPLLRSRSQDDYNSQSKRHSDQKNDHGLSETASHHVSSVQSTEPSHQQAEESLLPTYSTFVWHPVPTNSDSSRKFQTNSGDEDNNYKTESRSGDQVLQSTVDTKAQEERRRTARKRLLRQLQQPLSHSSDIPKPHTEEEVELLHIIQGLADLRIN